MSAAGRHRPGDASGHEQRARRDPARGDAERLRPVVRRGPGEERQRRRRAAPRRRPPGAGPARGSRAPASSSDSGQHHLGRSASCPSAARPTAAASATIASHAGRSFFAGAEREQRAEHQRGRRWRRRNARAGSGSAYQPA